MTKTEITRAMNQADDDAVARLIAELRTADDDAMHALIEDIRTAVRADTADDIMVDLKDFGQLEAVQIIKSNY